MKDEIYRAAYDEANSELQAVFEQVEQLRLRKVQIEKVVETLKPLVGFQGQSAPSMA